MIQCDFCEREFDPIRYRFLCPTCKTKNSCCEGEPLPVDNCADHPRTIVVNDMTRRIADADQGFLETQRSRP